jgi:hypothetical protein
MNLDGSPAIPMTTNVNKSGGYLEVIVSEVKLWLTGVIRVAMTRSLLVSEEGPEESDYPLYTLPLIS